jgi:hypothetical protein
MKITARYPRLVCSLMVIFLVDVLVLTPRVWAASSAIEGIVQDPRGQPLRGAEIRIEGTEGSSFAKVTKTDSKGHYVYNGLRAGTYKVTLIVDSAIKASIANVDMPESATTKLNFELKRYPFAKPVEQGKHYVLVSAETGSHLAGKWIEVDDQAKMSLGMKEHLRSAGSNVMRRIQDNVTGLNP